MTIFTFTLLSPCKWTKLGQSLGKSKICPAFVHEPFSIQSVSVSQDSITSWDKFWTNVRHMSNLYPSLANPKMGLEHMVFIGSVKCVAQTLGNEYFMLLLTACSNPLPVSFSQCSHNSSCNRAQKACSSCAK